MESQEKQTKILLLVPPKLKKECETELKKRLKPFKSIALYFDHYPAKESDQSAYSYVIEFPWQISGIAKKLEAAKTIYSLSGLAWKNQKVSPLIREAFANRFSYLRKLVISQEESIDFLKLSFRHHQLQEQQKAIEKGKKQLKQLHKNLEESEYKKVYFQALDNIFEERVVQITGITTLEEVIKKLASILIIDDLGNHTLEGMQELGYKKKLLTAMKSKDFLGQYKQFSQDFQKVKKKADITQFLQQSPLFSSYDLIFFNNWHNDVDTKRMIVKIGIRKQSILSKKEEKLLRRKGSNPNEIKELHLARINVKKRLKQTKDEIQWLEKLPTTEIDTKLEKKYQRLRKVRKRLNDEISRKAAKIREISKVVIQQNELLLQDINLCGIMEENLGLQRWMQNQFDGISSGLLRKEAQKKYTNLEKLFIFTKFINTCKNLESQLQKTTQQYEILSNDLQKYAESSGQIDLDGAYQPILKEHIWNKLEMAVLCGELQECLKEDRRNTAKKQ